MMKLKVGKVYNVTKGKTLIERAEIADTFFPRFKGLLGRKAFHPGEGLVLIPCNAVHTLGMSFPIDVAFVDLNNKICHLVSGMPPNKVGKMVKRSRYAIEAPSGYFCGAADIGDEVRLES